MNKYETMYILNPSLEDERREALIQRFADIVKADGGEVESIDEWGKRKLAYPINYIPEGYYVLMNFSADSNVPAELERNYRIVEDVMRHVIIRKDA
ncbi:MAG: 30S ribosomal protein S6 [Christensenellaceae bacterium]|jgi:small subunit ribosomal protein S6|nr:30S ribosomal protein S6 [Christensenellaceae bacterium]